MGCLMIFERDAGDDFDSLYLFSSRLFIFLISRDQYLVYFSTPFVTRCLFIDMEEVSFCFVRSRCERERADKTGIGRSKVSNVFENRGK